MDCLGGSRFGELLLSVIGDESYALVSTVLSHPCASSTATFEKGVKSGPHTAMQTRTVKVSNLSEKATNRDIHDFFSFSGAIESIDVQSLEEGLKVAFVTFKDPESLDTAVLLSGATIVDQVVSITEVEDYHPSASVEHANSDVPPAGSVGSAATRAQDVIYSMLAKGYDLGKDAMNKAKTFDEKHQLSANATATVSSLDRKIGLSQKLSTGTAVVNEHVRAIDEKYQVLEKTRSALMAAEQKVSSAGSALMKNKYIFTSAAWVSGALSKVTKAAGEVGQKATEKVHTAETK
ncbi:hypothetical protein GOP47_0004363 [Adiantum capillus-veneris]|uniref:RRM domain-containing protein n=1 Tax=Adiantum capillus-veneris TaxID=13818 RepID=A0A9D4V7C4_ADICA|nr:hypothetical protein GOP47_0004363 [Adiantum capillus-veneris]